MAVSGKVVVNKSCGAMLNHFNLLRIPFSMRVPNATSVFKLRADKTEIDSSFNCRRAASYKMRLSRPRVELAFLQILSQCSFQRKVLVIVTPKYFVELSIQNNLTIQTVIVHVRGSLRGYS